ncbi:MAG: transketolase [Gammaproteobacteria bacterium]|nr:transketolase [Gammaproteobacteria bacterium]
MPTRRELANAIRALSMDAVQAANSGHPGAPMGMADIAEVLWNDYLKHNPADPKWQDRDRFVLSNGHGSMLIYSLLHLTGYDLPLQELKNFRQLGSKTAGHPEYAHTPGVETTTGPLGQGISNAVGMALSEKILAERFNQPNFPIVDHHTYVFLGDGCLMEGISHEACSLAGTIKLGKLIAFWDDNGISIDGEVDGWFTDNTPERFKAYGWQVIADVDGHDPEAVKAAIEQARSDSDKPTLICCKTVIGYGAPNKQGTASCHGAALGDDEIAKTRDALDWPHAPFDIPTDIRTQWDALENGKQQQSAWEQMFTAYAKAHPELAKVYSRQMSGNLPSDWEEAKAANLQAINAEAAGHATRKASQRALDAIGPLLPELVGGSADLTGSNNTFWKGSKGITANDASGNYIYFGVREFAMSAIMNGMALHGGFIPYGATFLTFSDYARNAVRMAALMEIGSVFVYTHDSIGLGEDGPTHQPVEHTASLRLMPNLNVWRPCDGVESYVAWESAIEQRNTPSALIFTRQNLPHQQRNPEQLANIAKGGYVLYEPETAAQAVIIATGSEVHLATQAATTLAAEGVAVRVVSMPSTELFEQQAPAYRESVLPASLSKRVVVEAGASGGWYKYTGLNGRIIGLDRYGESAPASQLFKKFGFSVENVVSTLKELL